MRSFPFYRLSPLSLLVYFTAEVAAVSSMKCLPAQGEFFAAAAGAELLFGSGKKMMQVLFSSLLPAFVIFVLTLLTFGQGRAFWRFSVFKATFPGLREASFLSLAFLNICLASLFEKRAQEKKGAGRMRSKAHHCKQQRHRRQYTFNQGRRIQGQQQQLLNTRRGRLEPQERTEDVHR